MEVEHGLDSEQNPSGFWEVCGVLVSTWMDQSPTQALEIGVRSDVVAAEHMLRKKYGPETVVVAADPVAPVGFRGDLQGARSRCPSRSE